MSDLDPVHIDDSHPCVPCFEKLVQERDAFGKRETELMQKLEMAREVLEGVALPPYKDSDLESLLETLRVCAKEALAKIGGQEGD